MKERILEWSFAVFAWMSALILFTAAGSLLGYLLVKGIPGLSLSLIFGTTRPLDALLLSRPVLDGIFPALAGTVLLVILSVSIALPLGIGAGIYMAEFAPPRMKRIFGGFFDVLAGVPSIVVGLYGFCISVFIHRYVSPSFYPCLLISALSLSFLILPYLIRSTQTALEGIPSGLRLTAVALGASRIQNLFHVLIPRSLPGIVSGVVLSIGRCAEDTAVIMLTGAAASAGLPHSLLGSYEALPFYIYTVSSQYTDAVELSNGYGAAILLLAVCGLFFFLSFIIKQRLGASARHIR